MTYIQNDILHQQLHSLPLRHRLQCLLSHSFSLLNSGTKNNYFNISLLYFSIPVITQTRSMANGWYRTRWNYAWNKSFLFEMWQICKSISYDLYVKISTKTEIKFLIWNSSEAQLNVRMVTNMLTNCSKSTVKHAYNKVLGKGDFASLSIIRYNRQDYNMQSSYRE